MHTKVESKRDETTENQVGDLDPSGFIRITGEATGHFEMGEDGRAIGVIGSPAIRESLGIAV